MIQPAERLAELLPIGALRQPGLRLAVVADVVPERNGVGAYYRDLIAQLEPWVDRAVLIAPEMDDGRWQLGPSLPMPGDPTQPIALPAVRRIRRQLAELAPTAVIVPTPGPFGFLGMQLARRHRARLLVGFHTHLGHLTDLYWQSVAARAVRLGQWWIDQSHRRLFARADLVLANSREMLAIARAHGASAAHLMGTPIPQSFVATPPAPLGIPPSRVIFAGRLAPEKNLSAILQAAEALPDLDFVVVGEGPLRGQVEASAARLPNLRHRGWLPREALREAIDAADVLVLPSTVESFGTIALEAMARGRLVLVGARCGILDWPALRPGLEAIGEDEHLARALSRLRARSPERLRRLAERAREAALDLHRWTLERWLDMLVGDAPD